MIYLDTSAAAKAMVVEDETDSIRNLLESDVPMISSRLLAVEMHAIADRRGIDPASAQEIVDRISLASVSDDVAARAIELRSGLRTLDALHLASALSLADIADEFLAYDRELVAAAQSHGLAIHPLAGL